MNRRLECLSLPRNNNVRPCFATIQSQSVNRNLMRSHIASMKIAAMRNRRHLILGSSAAAATTFLPLRSKSSVPVPYDWSAVPPMDSGQSFIDWMIRNRGESPGLLGQRWDRFQPLLAQHHIWDDIYNGRSVSFVPFTKLEGEAIKAGTARNNARARARFGSLVSGR